MAADNQPDGFKSRELGVPDGELGNIPLQQVQQQIGGFQLSGDSGNAAKSALLDGMRNLTGATERYADGQLKKQAEEERKRQEAEAAKYYTQGLTFEGDFGAQEAKRATLTGSQDLGFREGLAVKGAYSSGNKITETVRALTPEQIAAIPDKQAYMAGLIKDQFAGTQYDPDLAKASIPVINQLNQNLGSYLMNTSQDFAKKEIEKQNVDAFLEQATFHLNSPNATNGEATAKLLDSSLLDRDKAQELLLGKYREISLLQPANKNFLAQGPLDPKLLTAMGARSDEFAGIVNSAVSGRAAYERDMQVRAQMAEQARLTRQTQMLTVGAAQASNAVTQTELNSLKQSMLKEGLPSEQVDAVIGPRMAILEATDSNYLLQTGAQQAKQKEVVMERFTRTSAGFINGSASAEDVQRDGDIALRLGASPEEVSRKSFRPSAGVLSSNGTETTEFLAAAVLVSKMGTQHPAVVALRETEPAYFYAVQQKNRPGADLRQIDAEYKAAISPEAKARAKNAVPGTDLFKNVQSAMADESENYFWSRKNDAAFEDVARRFGKEVYPGISKLSDDEVNKRALQYMKENFTTIETPNWGGSVRRTAVLEKSDDKYKEGVEEVMKMSSTETEKKMTAGIRGRGNLLVRPAGETYKIEAFDLLQPSIGRFQVMVDGKSLGNYSAKDLDAALKLSKGLDVSSGVARATGKKMTFLEALEIGVKGVTQTDMKVAEQLSLEAQGVKPQKQTADKAESATAIKARIKGG